MTRQPSWKRLAPRDLDMTSTRLASLPVAAAPVVHVGLLGKGTVGGSLLSLLAQRSPDPFHHNGGPDARVRLAGLADRRRLLLGDDLPARSARQALSASTLASDALRLVDHVAQLAEEGRHGAPPSTGVLVDCTAADGMEAVYAAAFARGVHVVTANKKPLTIAADAAAVLRREARAARASFLYETTAGAALPIIGTLQDLLATGDEVRAVEGSLSGTLGFLSDVVSRGERLSLAVRRARSLGYTEPHPRDDLAGLDVARKALILARELGASIELHDIPVEPFVPAALLAHDDPEALLTALADHDDAFEREVTEARARGLTLRYLATVEVLGHEAAATTVQARVGRVFVPADHPAARLQGTDAMVSFSTERYGARPLVVQGAGAGGHITASGLLAGVLSLAR